MSDMSSRNELYENERRELEEKKEDSSSSRRAGENSTTMTRFTEYKILDENKSNKSTPRENDEKIKEIFEMLKCAQISFDSGTETNTRTNFGRAQ